MPSCALIVFTADLGIVVPVGHMWLASRFWVVRKFQKQFIVRTAVHKRVLEMHACVGGPEEKRSIATKSIGAGSQLNEQ